MIERAEFPVSPMSPAEHAKTWRSKLVKTMPDSIDAGTARPTADLFLDRVPPYPGDWFKGRGVVICGGGRRYLTCAWVCIKMLRRFGCQLPVELWHVTRFEMDRPIRRVFEPLGVTFVNGEEVRRRHPVRGLAGWELKPYAILQSRFEEVLFLDADNVPVADPAPLFQSDAYARTGVIFWPDYGRLDPERMIWSICGVPYRDEPEFESGQIVVDKRRCWQALQLTMHLNEYSDFYYSHIHGDKETFHMAWRMLQQDYAMVPHGIAGLPGCMCQHDFEGKRIFQHRNLAKWEYDGENVRISGFQYEQECLNFLADLRTRWDGKVGCDWNHNSKETTIADSIISQRYFQYHRIGHDDREIELLPEGRIGKGRGGCEECWLVEEESDGPCVLVLAGSNVQTCRLRPDSSGAWRGRWLIHERMPIQLVPTAPPAPADRPLTTYNGLQAVTPRPRLVPP